MAQYNKNWNFGMHRYQPSNLLAALLILFGITNSNTTSQNLLNFKRLNIFALLP
jgi:hypothetical protein